MSDERDPSAQAGLPPGEFAARRARVLAALGPDALVVGAGTPVTYARDVEHRFRVDSDFYWLTGLAEPGAVLVLRGGAEQPFTLFVRPREPEREAWTGPRIGPEGAVAGYGADRAYPLGELPLQLPELLDGAERLHFAPWKSAALDQAVQRALGELALKEAQGRRAPGAIVLPAELLHELRLVKSAGELAALRRAAELTAQGVAAGIARVAPGRREAQVQAAVEAAFLEHGASGPAFPTIVAAGAHACCLHYSDNRGAIGAGELVLIDAGAECALYNGDISRTVPADGRFAPAQRAVYEIVLEAEQAAIAAVRPGATLQAVHDAALAVLVRGLVELGLLSGPLELLLETRAYRSFFMHRTSHWLGVDVHDVGRTHAGGAPRPLVPGMVFTVEPGLYLAPGAEGVPPEFAGLGIRLEDDVAVTADGAEVLTRGVPIAPDAVAALVGTEGP
ncbi:MAG: aminopeptidase P N-terminal domain-containing protein [Acidobacteria bacterium]|jgi:Xaa-Pro aminopeptidase|nr:aminopeptidase P N-terminal domain-containing protein [Acidobacteriota bacterium]